VPLNLQGLLDVRHYRLLWRTLKDIRYLGVAEFWRRGFKYLWTILLPGEADPPSLEEGLTWLRAGPETPRPLTSPIDIVIPVYNGMDHLRRVVESVLAHTDGPFRLLLCDDGSDDPQVRAYLSRVAAKWDHVLLHRSGENRGFVATVNDAMARVGHHFVLLNQDTEVPPGWLPRLMAPLLAEPERVASVTPLSNAADLCSFPRMLEDNPLCEGLDVTELDGYFRRVVSRPVETPTGVGFCMAFNHELVRRIGLFDPAFGRGYGEENDWCRRAAALGYRHLIVPDLLVYHAHGAIFGAEKQHCLEINRKRLYRRHPDYLRRVDAFIRSDPLKPLRTLLPCIIRASSRGRCDFWVEHALGGGAGVYAHARQEKAITEGKGVLTMTAPPGRKYYLLTYRDRDREFGFRFETPEALPILARHVPLRRIHLNSLAGFADPLAWLPVLIDLRRHGPAITLYLHDYFPLCPRYTLLDHHLRFCRLPPEDRCRACLASGEGEYDVHFQRPIRDIGSWRRQWRMFLGECDEIVAFSASSKTLFCQVWPDLDRKVVVRPHRLDPIPADLSERTAAIGVVGRISEAKGLPVLREMARILERRGSRLKIVVLGELTGSAGSSHLLVTGAYRREALADLAARHHLKLFFLPSLWPETFCYTAEEVMAMGGYLAVFGLGAQAERVCRYARGRVLGTMEPGAALKEIVEWGKELELWDETLLGTDPL